MGIYQLSFRGFTVALLSATWLLAACTTDTPGGDVAGGIEMSGDIGDYNPEEGVDDPVHDPAVLKSEDEYVLFSTGIERDPSDPGGIFMRKSADNLGGPWESIGEIPVPEWIDPFEPNHLWAPMAIKQDERCFLYFSVSSFGSNRSAIGVASSSSPLDPASWEDHGILIESGAGTSFNAIDPHVFEYEGQLWLTFGSHFSGIHIIEMESPTQINSAMNPQLLQSRPGVPHNPVEAPSIIERNGYFYLFTSWDQCCSGLDSTYKIAVGRSDKPEGPYFDQEGEPLVQGGGTILLEEEGNQIGPGGQDVYSEDGTDYLIHHYYDADADGVIRFQIRELSWEDDWPTLE
ncbi:arabinan endo-1,5-alpha-L-arabinosidase [Salisediminibacterium selenitireducens]|uniref:Endo-alpha-(1->5)-L-arabinanase n=1 Tax=Bacillus selenitireducens (strain ATCC 700615 / DSM 15326 / MLS10) TaxID=439292 RepID=D6XWN2_BACIE|nr:arabinan endo-1,5-alpha-L-arabinosidase [Salisediminibacterium selenitireducens]ADH97874.1 Arabinan endo-1,5-alpha-L-arabinosidase [[Bacillus] selenitireducens MLS10]